MTIFHVTSSRTADTCDKRLFSSSIRRAASTIMLQIYRQLFTLIYPPNPDSYYPWFLLLLEVTIPIHVLAKIPSSSPQSMRAVHCISLRYVCMYNGPWYHTLKYRTFIAVCFATFLSSAYWRTAAASRISRRRARAARVPTFLFLGTLTAATAAP